MVFPLKGYDLLDIPYSFSVGVVSDHDRFSVNNEQQRSQL